jgi:N-glycosylase/DNA lyase
MKAEEIKNTVVVSDLKDFDLGQTMECGQCFHFIKLGENEYGISAYGHLLHAKQDGNSLYLYNTGIEEFENIWRHYFDLDRDYGEIKAFLLKGDEKLREAVETMWGVRILNQEFFETLISFIISQNKQIPHIKQIVANISKGYGEYLGSIDGNEFYRFPTAEELSAASEEDLRACKTGFRAPYIWNAVQFVKDGILNEEELRSCGIEECRNRLMQIKGVGMKVANCVSLFGLGHREAFPVDVWIKRIMEVMYFNGQEHSNKEIEEYGVRHFGSYGGYAQQYLFYYGKTEKIGK